MNKPLRILFIVSIILFVCCIGLILHYRDYENEGIPIPIESQFKFGPVMLNIDEEWKIEENGNKFIRIGFNQKFIKDKISDIEYSDKSPKSLSFQSGIKEISNIDFIKGKYFEIYYYDIPVSKQNLWVDLYLNLHVSYHHTGKITTYIFAPRSLYIFHPEKKQFWGLDEGNEFNLYKCNTVTNFLDREIFEGKYIPTSTTDLIFDRPESVIEKIVSERIFCIPSIEFLEKQNDKQIKMDFAHWYVEK